MCSSSHNKSICLALFAVIGVIALTNVADASANHALMEMRTILDDGFDAAHDQVKGDEKHKHPRLQSGVHRTLGKMIALGYALKSTCVPNEVANRTKVVVGGLIDEASVPDKIKDFFAAKGAKALSDENKSELDCVNHCLEKESISDEDQDEESAKSGGAGIHQDINDNLNLRSLSSGGSRVYQGRFDESFGTGSINCSSLMDTEKCLAECHKDSGAVGGQQQLHDHETPFLDYIEHYINQFSGSICHGDPNKVIKFDEILKDCEFKLAPISMGKFLFSEGLTFVDNFLSAQELSKQCTLVRKTLIDSFASSLKALCQDSDQDGRELDSMVHLAAGLVLALNTEGRMIEQCPEVYHIRVGHQKPRTHSLQQQEDLESHSHSEPRN